MRSRYSDNYSDFAAQLCSDLCDLGYSAFSYGTPAKWKTASGSADSRQFIVLSYDTGTAKERSVTVDVQKAFEGHLMGLKAEDTLSLTASYANLCISADKVEQLYKASPNPPIIPRDATCMAPCLDGGASLRAYHKKIGYVPESESIYRSAFENAARAGEAFARGGECTLEDDSPEMC